MNTVSQKQRKGATFTENLREAEAQAPREEPNFDAVIERQRQRQAAFTGPRAALNAYYKQRRGEIDNA